MSIKELVDKLIAYIKNPLTVEADGNIKQILIIDNNMVVGRLSI